MLIPSAAAKLATCATDDLHCCRKGLKFHLNKVLVPAAVSVLASHSVLPLRPHAYSWVEHLKRNISNWYKIPPIQRLAQANQSSERAVGN